MRCFCHLPLLDFDVHSLFFLSVFRFSCLFLFFLFFFLEYLLVCRAVLLLLLLTVARYTFCLLKIYFYFLFLFAADRNFLSCYFFFQFLTCVLSANKFHKENTQHFEKCISAIQFYDYFMEKHKLDFTSL